MLRFSQLCDNAGVSALSGKMLNGEDEAARPGKCSAFPV